MPACFDNPWAKIDFPVPATPPIRIIFTVKSVMKITDLYKSSNEFEDLIKRRMYSRMAVRSQ